MDAPPPPRPPRVQVGRPKLSLRNLQIGKQGGLSSITPGTPPPFNPSQSIDAILRRTAPPWEKANETKKAEAATPAPAVSQRKDLNEKKLSDWETELNERDRLLRRAKAMMDERERNVQEQEALLEARERYLQEGNRLLEEQKRQLAARLAKAAEMSIEENAGGEAEVSGGAVAVMEKMKAELDQREQAVREQEALIKERESFIAESEHVLFEKAQQIQELETQLESYRDQLAARRKNLDEREGIETLDQPEAKEVL